MADNAPWLDYQQPAATAAPAASPVTTQTSNAPWLDYQAKAEPQGYVQSVAKAGQDFNKIDAGFGETLLGNAEAASKVILGGLAFPAAVASTLPRSVASAVTGGYVAKPTTADVNDTTTKLQGLINKIPQNQVANGLTNLLSTASAPIGDVLKSVSTTLSDDKETQKYLESALPYTLAAVGVVRSPVKPSLVSEAGDATTTAAGGARQGAFTGTRLTNIADEHNIPLTQGQVLASAAEGLGAKEDAGIISAMNLPAQIEAKVAQSPKGQKLANFMKDQQNSIVDRFSDAVLDRDLPADLLSNKKGTGLLDAIDRPMPGILRLNPDKLEAILTRNGISDPELLKDLHDFHHLASETQNITPVELSGQGSSLLLRAAGSNLLPLAAGAAAGASSIIHGLGFGEAGLGVFGGHYVGEIVNKLPVNRQIARVSSQAASGKAFSISDVRAMAQQAGISTDEMSMELMKRGFNLR